MRDFLKSKLYLVIVFLAAAAAYGFAVTHYSIGMDDTAVELYYEDGVAPYVGRWTLFVLNMLIPITECTPWLTECCSVLLLVLSVTCWCSLWKRVCEPALQIPMWGYALAAAVFLSSPIISEIFVFYLHNGICIGYGLTAMALHELLNSLDCGRLRGNRIFHGIISAALLVLALGCYESFGLVYVMGAIILFALSRVLYGKTEGKGISNRFFVWLFTGLGIMAVSLAVRELILKMFEIVYQLDRYSVYELRYRHLFGTLFSEPGEFTMTLKKFYVKYYVNAVTYLPIAVLVAAMALLGIAAIVLAVRKRDGILILCFAGLVLLPVGMSIVEGLTTRYRSAQYVPMVCGFAVLVFAAVTANCGRRAWVGRVAAILLEILVYNQCADMNGWFYEDWQKYEYAKEVMLQVAEDLKASCDTSKPIVFRGGMQVPYSVSEKAYVSYDSVQYKVISALTDPIDVHLKEKFHNGVHGYVSAEMPIVSVLSWGITAFGGTGGQLIKFWEMHGIEGLVNDTNLEHVEEAEQIRSDRNMPAYPQDGYILECEDYIIVNLAN